MERWGHSWRCFICFLTCLFLTNNVIPIQYVGMSLGNPNCLQVNTYFLLIVEGRFHYIFQLILTHNPRHQTQGEHGEHLGYNQWHDWKLLSDVFRETGQQCVVHRLWSVWSCRHFLSNWCRVRCRHVPLQTAWLLGRGGLTLLYSSLSSLGKNRMIMNISFYETHER